MFSIISIYWSGVVMYHFIERLIERSLWNSPTWASQILLGRIDRSYEARFEWNVKNSVVGIDRVVVVLMTLVFRKGLPISSIKRTEDSEHFSWGDQGQTKLVLSLLTEKFWIEI
jgi:hypothetical protein